MNKEINLAYSKVETDSLEYRHHSTSSLIEIRFKNPREYGLTELWLDYSEIDGIVELIDKLRK